MSVRLLSFVAGCCALFLSCAARAVPDDCTISSVGLNFGTYDTVNPLPGSTTLTVFCENTGPAKTFNYVLRLSRGPGPSYANRQQTGGGETLNYNLYTTASYTSIWGDGTGGSVQVNGSVTVGANSSAYDYKTVYGLIAGSQNVTPGSYTTATPITVTLSGVKSSDRTDTFYISVTVAAQCNASATNLAFGTVSPLSSQTDGQSAITVYCTKNTPYTVGLNAGVTSGATIAQRLMVKGADTMLYNLYTNMARTSVWGNSSGSWVSGTGVGLGATGQSLPVYGRVAAGQVNLVPGSYQENTITATITY